MRRRCLVPLLGTFVLAAAGRLFAISADDTATVAKLIPAELPFATVFSNLDRFDKSVKALVKRIDPDNSDGGMLESIKSQLPLAEWVDFSKPFAMGAASLVDNDGGLWWACVPEFAAKIKEHKGASEEEGVWKLTSEGRPDMFARAVEGNYVVIATGRDQIRTATKGGSTLADALKPRAEFFDGRDVYTHIEFEAVRPLVLAQIGQAAQMAPMFAMMAGPSMGEVDPAAMTTLFTALLDAIKAFAEQAAYLEFSGSLDDKDARITIAAGFRDGAIGTYLSRQKPAEIPLFDSLSERAYMMAFGYHFPGNDSPFLDYVIEKTHGAMKPANAPTGADGAAVPPANDAIQNTIKQAREMYRKIEGQNLMMWVESHGLHMQGDYFGKDAAGILDLQKQMLVGAQSLAKMFGGGVSYQPNGSKQISGQEVFQYSMKVDDTKLGGASAAGLFSADEYYAIAAMRDRVRFAIGCDKEVEQAFSSEKSVKSFAGAPAAKETLEKLPSKRNVIGLIDVNGVFSFLKLLGVADYGTVSPAPPIGFSASFSGEPARVDIHVPLKVIDRIVQVTATNQPA